MKVWVSSLLVLSTLAGPAWAYRDKKLEEAVAKAEEQIAKGKPEEAAKGMLKAAQGLKTGEAYVALGRIQDEDGDEHRRSGGKLREGEGARRPGRRSARRSGGLRAPDGPCQAGSGDGDSGGERTGRRRQTPRRRSRWH